MGSGVVRVRPLVLAGEANSSGLVRRDHRLYARLAPRMAPNVTAVDVRPRTKRRSARPGQRRRTLADWCDRGRRRPGSSGALAVRLAAQPAVLQTITGTGSRKCLTWADVCLPAPDGRNHPVHIPYAVSSHRHRPGCNTETTREEVPPVTTSGVENMPHPRRGRVSLDELARRKGVRPVEVVEDMAQDGVFESDEELEEFLAHVRDSRQADLA